MVGEPEPEPESIPGAAESRQDFPLAEYAQMLLKRWRLIAIAVILSLGWSIANTIMTRPSFRASVTLDVEPDRGSPLDVTPVSQFYYLYDPNFISTQLRLMKSREMATRVAQRLNLAAAGPVVGPRPSVTTDAKSDDSALVQMALGIQGGVDVNPIKDTNLVELSFVDSNPKRAAEVANAVAESYIDWSLESKYRAVGQASRFLTAQIEQLRSEVQAKERQLVDFGRQKDIMSTDPQANSTIQNVELLNKDYSDAIADRIAKEARYNELQNAPADTSADTISNGVVTQLRADQARLERDYADKLNIYKPEWPAMQQLKTQIEKGRQHLQQVVSETVAKAREATKADYLSAVRREESFKSALHSERMTAIGLNSNAVEYNNLKIEVETKRGLLDTLSKRQSEAEMMTRLSTDRESNVRVVDPALVPTYRFRPSYRQNLSKGLLMGLMLGVGLAFFLEYLDRSLRTADQVENFLKLPAIGIIPSAASATGAYGYGYGYGQSRLRRAQKKASGGAAAEDVAIELLPHAQPRSTVAEAYRAARAALLLSRAGGVRLITVTSCFPREGKTTTCANLAVVLGQLGKKVLLVDADLHKPRLHEIFKISNRVGLVSILAENLDPAQAIFKTSIPEVFITPAGPISPNPSGLLASDAMSRFLARAAATFDYVLIDTPPVLPVADAILIGHQTDGVLICVKGGKTSREQVRRMRDKLLRSDVRILGVLINNLEQTTRPYGSAYGYYGGGYGEREEPAAKATPAAPR